MTSVVIVVMTISIRESFLLEGFYQSHQVFLDMIIDRGIMLLCKEDAHPTPPSQFSLPRIDEEQWTFQ